MISFREFTELFLLKAELSLHSHLHVTGGFNPEQFYENDFTAQDSRIPPTKCLYPCAMEICMEQNMFFSIILSSSLSLFFFHYLYRSFYSHAHEIESALARVSK